MADERALSGSEQALLDMVRDGRVDAEIAVRLGIGTEDVRRRISELAARLGVHGRDGLRGYRPGAVSSSSSRRGRHVAVVVAALAFGGALFAAGIWLGRATSPAAHPAVADAASASPAALAATTATTTDSPGVAFTSVPPPPTPTKFPTSTFDGAAYADLGAFIVVPGHPRDAVAAVDRRAALSILTLADAGLIQFDGPQRRRVLNGTLVYAETTVAGVRIAIFAAPADARTALKSNDTFASTVDGRPSLLVWATDTGGVAEDTRNLRQYRTAVDARGELYVSMEPIAPSTVVDQTTGAAVDVTIARWLGLVPSTDLTTSCDPGGRCSVVVMGGSFPAPAPGAIECDAEGTYEYVDGGSQDRITFEAFNGYLIPECPAAPQLINANTVVVNGFYVAHAFDRDGNPISLAIAPDGKMYAGNFVAPVGCPCFPHD